MAKWPMTKWSMADGQMAVDSWPSVIRPFGHRPFGHRPSVILASAIPPIRIFSVRPLRGPCRVVRLKGEGMLGIVSREVEAVREFHKPIGRVWRRMRFQ